MKICSAILSNLHCRKDCKYVEMTFYTINFFLEIIYQSDDKIKQERYLGNLKNGLPDGQGTMTWKDGQIYNGKK